MGVVFSIGFLVYDIWAVVLSSDKTSAPFGPPYLSCSGPLLKFDNTYICLSAWHGVEKSRSAWPLELHISLSAAVGRHYLSVGGGVEVTTMQDRRISSIEAACDHISLLTLISLRWLPGIQCISCGQVSVLGGGVAGHVRDPISSTEAAWDASLLTPTPLGTSSSLCYFLMVVVRSQTGPTLKLLRTPVYLV